MSYPIENLKGMTTEIAAKIRAENIQTTDQLLEHSKTAQQRADLARKAGTTPVMIKEFANRADLMRLKGIGGDISNLLEEAGVNSCKELQHRIAENLHKTLVDINKSQHIAHHVPPVASLQEWITLAKTLSQTATQE